MNCLSERLCNIWHIKTAHICAHIRQSHKNPAIKKIYETYLGEPCGELSHKLLHTEYCNRQDLLQ